ncbi:MAG TPA: proton-conducting transporter membrane subunit, partial [Candidatus Elarobacter sp.]|nr:proton-conducting transporter membrane subunit [Candidatus Elarobacter sp.]
MAAAGPLVALAIGLGAFVLGLGGVAGNTWTVAVPWLVPLGGLELTLDPLAGLFLALVGGVALPASVFALGSTGRAGRGALAYPVFVASMCVVPLAANTMTFVMAWELMSLASYFLVLHEREERASVRAAWVYAVMTHAGLVCLLAGMLLMGAWTGSPRFADWRVAAPALGAAARSV